MNKLIFVLALVVSSLVAARSAPAQVGGNIYYSEQNGYQPGGVGKSRAEALELNRRRESDNTKPPTGTTTFAEGNVLINVKADEFVAVFGLAEEAPTVAECARKMETRALALIAAIKELGVDEADLFLDFVTQTRSYGYEFTGDIAREKLVGFELKKNLSVHYKDHAMIEKLTLAASRFQVYDLIKVDYIVKDIPAVQDRLMEEAAKVVKRKSDRYEKLLGVKLQPPAQVFAEKYGIHYPTQLYDSYVAAESEQLLTPYERQKFTIQSMRKSRTTVFNGLDGALFDVVVNPVILEPTVQFTIHLKVKYEVEQLKAK